MAKKNHFKKTRSYFFRENAGAFLEANSTEKITSQMKFKTFWNNSHKATIHLLYDKHSLDKYNEADEVLNE